MYEQTLIQAGLSKDQAEIYEILIKGGPALAREIHLKATISRPLVYKVLEELVEMSLVEKDDQPGKVARFIAAHPIKLKEVADKQFEQAKNTRMALESVLAALVSDFSATSGKPGIRILPGLTGITELYEDILNEHQNILLIRSPKDDTHPELAKLVDQQIREQVRAGIHTRAITPLASGSPENVTQFDAARLVTRKIVPQETFNIPAQIIVYGNKVAITAYGTELMTTIIENPEIKITFELLFEYVWRTAPNAA